MLAVYTDGCAGLAGIAGRSVAKCATAAKALLYEVTIGRSIYIMRWCSHQRTCLALCWVATRIVGCLVKVQGVHVQIMRIAHASDASDIIYDPSIKIVN